MREPIAAPTALCDACGHIGTPSVGDDQWSCARCRCDESGLVFDLSLDQMEAMLRDLVLRIHDMTARPDDGLDSQDLLDLATRLHTLDRWYEDELR